MRKIVKHKKTLTWTGTTVAVIVLLTAGIGLHLNTLWRPLLRERIKEIVLSSSDSLYTIDFDDIGINVVSGNVRFRNVVLKPDTNVYNRMKVEGRAPKHLYDASVQELVLKRVHPWKVYSGKGLEMNDLIINSPTVKVLFENIPQKDTIEKVQKTVYQHISKYLRSVAVSNIFLRNVDFKYIDRSLSDPEVVNLQDVDVTVKDLRIDSLSQFDKTRFYYTKDIFIQINNHKLKTKSKFYDISFGELTASTAKGYARLKDLKIIPRYGDMDFSRKFNVQTDRYSLSFDDILLTKLDFSSLNISRQLKASRLEIGGAKINIFLNRELPPPDFDKGRNYPQLALRRFKLNTIIDTVKIENTEINYTEYNPLTEARGTVFFRRIEGTIVNVTNDSLALKKNNWCRGSFSSFLMGEGLLKFRINFNLTDRNSAFDYSGSLGQMNIKALNPVLRPLGMVEANSGRIMKAVFSVRADYRKSSGKLELFYNDLKVGILEKKEESTQLTKRGIISFITNALLISDSNPSPGNPLRIGYGTYLRPDQGSFFSLLWRGVFAGIKTTVGFNAARERQLRASFEKLKKSYSERNDRREKREERREKREARQKNVGNR